ncbi:protein S100-A13-like [Sardina pilchardus]|uniref:protein S100-A13-like n=1 Tax=Sardina pilchardus TaxID=27697 RepID=UPI002E148156
MNVEMAIQTVVHTFQKWAGRDGRINKQQFSHLLQSDLRHYLTGTGYGAPEQRFWGHIMGNNSNGKMTFEKYLEFVQMLASQVREAGY